MLYYMPFLVVFIFGTRNFHPGTLWNEICHKISGVNLQCMDLTCENVWINEVQ